MCGISGILRTDDGPPDQAAVREMTARLAHRGPDDEGFLFDGPVGIGHRRLRIIDPEGGAQPIADESGRFWVVLNGEIYNFRELRRDLESRHRFRTRTDTEVLVHLYEERGDAFLDDLNGMFALALWDARDRILLLARDRLGIKPLYIAERPGAILFASEIKALFGSGRIDPEVDRAALYAFLRLKYVPGPATMFRAVEKLPPGTMRKYGPGGIVRRRRYWQLPQGGERPSRPQQAAEEVAALLEDAVRLRLVADVPIGLLLSGGVDSTALLAVMHRRLGPGARTFTVAFPQFGHFDESAVARRTAARFGAVHSELAADRVDLPDLLFRLAWQVDEPISDPALLPTWLLCRRARREVTVALSGEGADELFGGYNKYRRDLWLTRWGRLPRPLRSLAARWISAGGGPRRMHRLGRRAAMPAGVARVIDWSALFSADEIAALSDGAFGPRDEEQLLASLGDRAGADPADPAAALRFDLQTTLVDALLMKVDKASMAHGLEVRVPFLDHRLVEHAVALPFGWKVRRGETKWILKQAMRDLVPSEILDRPKHGFDVPVSAWLRGELRDTARACLEGAPVAERRFFRRGAGADLLRTHLEGGEDRGEQLWGLLALEAWMRTYIEPAASTPSTATTLSPARRPTVPVAAGAGE